MIEEEWEPTEADLREPSTPEGNQSLVDLNRLCNYPFYSVMLDWNGDVMLCVQDWNKKVKMGNIASDSLFDVWRSSGFRKYRNVLKKGKRVLLPCSERNTNGILHGDNHVKRWMD